jgi:hypothetical protein
MKRPSQHPIDSKGEQPRYFIHPCEEAVSPLTDLGQTRFRRFATVRSQDSGGILCNG